MVRVRARVRVTARVRVRAGARVRVRRGDVAGLQLPPAPLH